MSIAQKTAAILENIKLKKEVDYWKKRCEAAEESLAEYEKRDNDPYWYWPQCDVEGCEQVSCCGGMCWSDTGYWSVCSKHSQMHRNGEPQPKMKDASIEKEKTRLPDGTLPSTKSAK